AHAATHAPGASDSISGSYVSLATAQTLSGAKTLNANLIMGSGQIAAGSGQAGVTIATSVFASGPVQFANLAADPDVTYAGQVYFDSSSNKLKLSENGGGFIDLIGGAGGAVPLQATTPGTTGTGHLNVSGTGVFGSSVAVGTLSPLSRVHVVDGDIRLSTTTGS